MKHFGIRVEVLPFIAVTALFFGLLSIFVAPLTSMLFACVTIGYLLFFFRDPERVPPCQNDAILAGADGIVTAVTDVHEETYLNTDCVRISIFLSLFDVHVNRAPIAGQCTFLGYFPGKRLFAFQEKSTDVNQHNKILIVGERTRCLVCQIVGAVVRRVVYWLPHDKAIEIAAGERIGMMKFGSRLDVYLPKEDVVVNVSPGDKVRASETIVARLKEQQTRYLDHSALKKEPCVS